MRNGLRLRVPWWCSHVTLWLHVRPVDPIVLCPPFQVPGWTPVLRMRWCPPAIEVSGQAPRSSRGLLLGQGSIACPLVTHRYIHLSQTHIHHVQEPVSVTVILMMRQTRIALFALYHFLFNCVFYCSYFILLHFGGKCVTSTHHIYLI